MYLNGVIPKFNRNGTSLIPSSVIFNHKLHQLLTYGLMIVLLHHHQRTGRDHQGVLVPRGWTLFSAIWEPTTSHWTKQSTWLRTALCGGWCLHMALRTPSGASQKRRRSAVTNEPSGNFNSSLTSDWLTCIILLNISHSITATLHQIRQQLLFSETGVSWSSLTLLTSSISQLAKTITDLIESNNLYANLLT